MVEENFEMWPSGLAYFITFLAFWAKNNFFSFWKKKKGNQFKKGRSLMPDCYLLIIRYLGQEVLLLIRSRLFHYCKIFYQFSLNIIFSSFSSWPCSFKHEIWKFEMFYLVSKLWNISFWLNFESLTWLEIMHNVTFIFSSWKNKRI